MLISVNGQTPVVPVRAEVVRKKLLDIAQTVARLRSWLPITVQRLEQDLMLQWAVQRGLQVAAEGIFDVGAHVLAGEFRESVDEYREVPKRLLAHGVISEETDAQLESLAGFRNVLVHQYAHVDLRRVHSALGRLDDFDAFVADVETWLGSASR
jgi:uncharacterized protein YutE (UPF0331/DUF86 family)